MNRKIQITFELENNRGKISLLQDGKEVPCLYGYELNFDSRKNELTFNGKRLATDQYGHFYVDDKGETATEEIDLLNYFSDEGQINEKIKRSKKELEFALNNVRQTSLFNAKRMIKDRLGESA